MSGLAGRGVQPPDAPGKCRARDGEVEVRLAPDQLAELARLIAAELAEASTRPAAERLVSVKELAVRLGVDPSWVYEHAEELGALRLGEGARPRLRFDVAEVQRRLASCPGGRESSSAAGRTVEPVRRLRRSSGSGTGVELLPVRGRGGAA